MSIFKAVMKCLSLAVLLLTVPSLGGCGQHTTTWQEDVNLLDGRTLEVTQKRLYEGAYNGTSFGSISREVWLTIALPEVDSKPIVWHEHLWPWVVNIYNGKLYVVGFPPTEREFVQYGSQRPPYLGFVYENRAWKRIPFTDIPSAIYETNMWIENQPPSGANRITLDDKKKLLSNPRYTPDVRKIDPHYQSNFD